MRRIISREARALRLSIRTSIRRRLLRTSGTTVTSVPFFQAQGSQGSTQAQTTADTVVGEIYPHGEMTGTERTSSTTLVGPGTTEGGETLEETVGRSRRPSIAADPSEAVSAPDEGGPPAGPQQTNTFPQWRQIYIDSIPDPVEKRELEVAIKECRNISDLKETLRVWRERKNTNTQLGASARGQEAAMLEEREQVAAVHRRNQLETYMNSGRHRPGS